MSARRACLAAFAAIALLALAPGAGTAESGSGAIAKTRADGVAGAPARANGATARKRARLGARRMRWRAASSAFRIGPGTLVGSGAAVPGGSTPTPGGTPGGAEPGGSSPAPPPVFHTLSVATREFFLTLSRQVLTPGKQTIQLNNRGEDPHNLVISPEDGPSDPVATYPDVESRGSHTEQVELPAGRYTLWCSLPGHLAKGMQAPLRVE